MRWRGANRARDLTAGPRGRRAQVEVSVSIAATASRGKRPSAFTPFYTTKAEGMGMGLNICRSIIEFHDGRLWSEPIPRWYGLLFTLL